MLERLAPARGHTILELAAGTGIAGLAAAALAGPGGRVFVSDFSEAMARELAPEGATSPDTADLAAVATQLEDTIAGGDPKQAKALLRLLIKDLRVNGRSEILPTYRVLAPEACATPSSVGGTWRCANLLLVLGKSLDVRDAGVGRPDGLA
jgi:hypothetical protein